MTLTHAAKSGQCESRSFSRFDTRDPIQPLSHKIGCDIRKTISGELQTRIGGKIVKMRKRANFNNIPDFFGYPFHVKFSG